MSQPQFLTPDGLTHAQWDELVNALGDSEAAALVLPVVGRFLMERVPVNAPGLAEFLLARIAGDEAVAREAIRERRSAGSGSPIPFVTLGPERVLAECKAKRGIVQDEPGYGEGDYYSGRDFQYDLALRRLAAVYSDHPDYREDWRT